MSVSKVEYPKKSHYLYGFVFLVVSLLAWLFYEDNAVPRVYWFSFFGLFLLLMWSLIFFADLKIEHAYKKHVDRMAEIKDGGFVDN